MTTAMRTSNPTQQQILDLQPYYIYGVLCSLPYVTDGRLMIFWWKSVQRITVNERANGQTLCFIYLEDESPYVGGVKRHMV
jgi:hypothetical protein